MGLSKETTDGGYDLLAHKGFDRVFERRVQMEYPDYFLQQLQGYTNTRHSPHAHSLSEKKPQPSLKMKVSSKYPLTKNNSRLYQENVGRCGSLRD